MDSNPKQFAKAGNAWNVPEERERVEEYVWNPHSLDIIGRRVTIDGVYHAPVQRPEVRPERVRPGQARDPAQLRQLRSERALTRLGQRRLCEPNSQGPGVSAAERWDARLEYHAKKSESVALDNACAEGALINARLRLRARFPESVLERVLRERATWVA